MPLLPNIGKNWIIACKDTFLTDTMNLPIVHIDVVNLHIVTGSGRESAAGSGGKNTFTLSPEQVRAMKDAGFWDDPEKRNKMIKRYAMEARQNQGYRS